MKTLNARPEWQKAMADLLTIAYDAGQAWQRYNDAQLTMMKDGLSCEDAEDLLNVTVVSMEWDMAQEKLAGAKMVLEGYAQQYAVSKAEDVLATFGAGPEGTKDIKRLVVKYSDLYQHAEA